MASSAVGPAPGTGASLSVGSLCVSVCSRKNPDVTPNPNGAYPGGGAGGNGQGGSSGGGWPLPACPPNPPPPNCPCTNECSL